MRQRKEIQKMSRGGCLNEKKISGDAYTFDDVLIVPLKSDVLPTEVRTNTKLTSRIELNVPIVSSAMDTVTESRLAIALAQQGGIGIIHRNMPIDKQAAEVDKVKRSESGMIVDPITMAPKDNQGRLRVGAAIGATGDYIERMSELVRAKVDVIVVDTAHGHSSRVVEAVKEVKRRLPDVDVIAGNIATEEAARDLVKAG